MTLPKANLTLCAATALALSGTAWADVDADGGAPAGTLEEVIVTAQKRAERLQDVPISIDVLGGDSLDKSTAQGVSEALRSVPGVATFESFEGGGTQVVVRGVTAPSAFYAGPSPIAYYLDSVPFGFVRGAIAPDTNGYDLDRVEVLRGPQGTLYGASALNGVVRVLTKDADLNNFDLKARVSTSYTDGGGANYRGDMAINVPIIDGKLALRAVVGDQDLSGWIDSPDKTRINNSDLHNYRLKLTAQPTDELSIRLSATGSISDFGAPSTARNDGTIAALGAQPYAIDYETYGLDIGYEFPSFSISSSTSLLDFYNQGLLDLTPFIDGDVPGAPLPFQTHVGSRTFAEELLLNSKGGTLWTWSAGAFYRDSKDHDFQLYVLDPTPPQNAFHDYSRSAAAFANLGQRLFGDTLEWSLGLRYFHDDVATQADPSLAGTGVPLGRLSDTFDSTTPRAVLTWKPTKDLTVYGAYSQGFRSGWPQNELAYTALPQAAPVKPDKLTNYEMGAKGDLLERRVSFDAAIYYIQWRDIQQVFDVVADGLCCASVGANANSASGVGADLSLTLRPLEGLELGLGVSWNNLSFDNPVLSDNIVLYGKGARPAYSPEYTASGSAAYSVPLGAGGYTGTLAASGNYVSKLSTADLSGSPFVAVTVTGDAMLMGRLSLAVSAPQHWTATLYADNINNWSGSLSRSYEVYGYPDWDTRVRPRTVGLQFDYSFK